MFAQARKLIEQMRSRDRGAALITVLLFVVLVFILITAMLSVTGNEIVIASLQRDGVRASELAQAGIQEAVRRVELGRPYMLPGGWTSSIDSRVNVTVTRVFTGTNSAYLEITATASNIGAATRKLTALVLQQIIAFPPDITFAASVREDGSAAITCGDAYAQSFIQYKSYPTNACAPPQTMTYAGWRVSKTAGSGPPVAPCYTHAGCVAANGGNPDVLNWYPGTRVGFSETTLDGKDILAFQANAEANGCVATDPAYNTTVPAGAILQTNVTLGAAMPQYGFDLDDPPAAAVPSQLDPDLFPCGLPYKWVAVGPPDLLDENGIPVTGGNPANTRWFKRIVFEQWFDNYWRYDEAKMTAVKRGNGLGTAACIDTICVKANTADPSPTVQPDLLKYPDFGAVPPFPETSSVTNNYDCSKTGTGTLNSLPTTCTRIDGTPAPTDHLGCKLPEMAAAAYCTQTEQKVFVLNGDWTVNGNIGGHGTLVVNGDLIVNGTFDYWGTIIVNGTLQAGTGAVNVHGGLVAVSTLQLIGNISVEGGGTVTNVPTGHSLVIGKAWWER